MCLRSPAIGVAIVCALSSSTTADYAIIGDDMGVGLSCAAKFHSLAKIGVTIQPLAQQTAMVAIDPSHLAAR
jgi:hypothetical protein